MVQVWPIDVPQAVVAGSLSETVEAAVASFSPEIGPSIDRPRSSMPMGQISFDVIMSQTELVVFENFWLVILKGGVLTFSRDHPRRGMPATFKFSSPPTWGQNGTTTSYRVSLKLQEVP